MMRWIVRRWVAIQDWVVFRLVNIIIGICFIMIHILDGLMYLMVRINERNRCEKKLAKIIIRKKETTDQIYSEGEL